jgi:EAL domain-containing protein (putative c-di-GMP-specific phosphodiesterase class I)
VATCAKCDCPPSPACAGAGADARVLVYAPAPPAMGKVRAAAAAAGYATALVEEYVAVLDGPPGGWLALLQALDERLSSIEASETRLAPIGGVPTDGFALATAGLKARTLPALVGETRDDWLVTVLREDRVTSHFQPIVDVETGTIFAHEALLRATAADGTIVPGGKIVDAGRRLGALHLLDQLGRKSAITGAHALGMQSYLFINFFPTVVYDPAHCLRTTREAMRQTGMQPEQIVFEVVESEDIADRQHLLNILARYRAEGFRVALDDLGSGYASLNMLADLRPDFVKLDMALVRGASDDPLRRGIVEAIVRSARQEGIRVVAEGIETLESARFLAGMGVPLLQGYLFGKPAPRLGEVADCLADVTAAARRTQLTVVNGHAPAPHPAAPAAQGMASLG